MLWLADVNAWDQGAAARHAAWLGPGERARCARFVRAERRCQFIAGRTLLRLMLGRLLEVAPATIELAERPGQAPSLLSATNMPVGFSITHSGRWVACAASSASAVGLDIERVDNTRDVLALAEQAFGAAGVQALRACKPAVRNAVFYRMWCAHEAAIKLGTQSSILYSFEPPGLACILACAEPLATAPELQQIRLNDF